MVYEIGHLFYSRWLVFALVDKLVNKCSVFHVSFHVPSYLVNWTDSVLADHADIVYPGGYGWYDFLFGMRDAKDVLWEW